MVFYQFFTGRRYRGERAYNFWEVYLPNLVEQVNAVNSTMIRTYYLCMFSISVSLLILSFTRSHS